jgi:hypothetical protein
MIWSSAARTLTLTLGAPTGSGNALLVATSALIASPNPAITSTFGIRASVGDVTTANQQWF